MSDVERAITYLPAEALDAMEADETQQIPESHAIRVRELRERLMVNDRG